MSMPAHSSRPDTAAARCPCAWCGVWHSWGQLGTTALAAGNLTFAWMEFGTVSIYGFQQ